MIQLKFVARTTLAFLPLVLLAACNRQKTDFPALPPVTQVTVSDYGGAKNNYQTTVWQISDAQKIARLVALADAQRAGWSDMGSANVSLQTGVELKFKGPSISRTFVVYPNGFSSSYSTGSNNLWASEGEYPNVTINIVIKEISDSAIEKLLADIAAVTNGVKPEPKPTPQPTPKVPPNRGTK